jgi:hypothetical protein
MLTISIITAALLGVWLASVMTNAVENCREKE